MRLENVTTVDAESFLELSRSQVILDVRAPSEFESGHIPGAVNLPLFDDDERAQVGKTYAQKGHNAAVLCGLEFAGRKMRALVETAQAVANPPPSVVPAAPTVLIHCWRGGMRSQSVAWLLAQADFSVTVLEGGYKAYRRHIQSFFSTTYPTLVVLSGLTGAGKTDQLQHLIEAGEQVIDLESLANHRGSAFGGIGLPKQPTVEQFENLLGDALRELDPMRRIWIEDEGRKIGTAVVPAPFFDQMKLAPAVFLDVPLSIRARRLTNDYGDAQPEELGAAIRNITKRLGGQNVQRALELLDANQLIECAEVLLDYYDRAYLNSKSKIPRATTILLPTTTPESTDTTRRILETANSMFISGG